MIIKKEGKIYIYKKKRNGRKTGKRKEKKGERWMKGEQEMVKNKTIIIMNTIGR